MNLEEIREFALGLSDVSEGMPFGPTVLVFKTNGKMFLLLPLDTEQIQFNVKCDPDLAIELRESYPEAVLPGYHMSKIHWNTIRVNGTLKTSQLQGMIRHSHQLVQAGPKKSRTKK
jgi:predicted DNA-binding protein (MmcQ/YjbR family)